MRTVTLAGALEAIEGLRVRTDVPLARLTTFKIGGPAAVLVTPESPEALAEAMRIVHEDGAPTFVLGNGSNLLVSDAGFDGVVFRVGSALGGIEATGPDTLTLGAGTLWSRVLRFVSNEGWTGLEYGTGIPGTMGGAVATNAGTRAGDTAGALVDATIVTADGASVVLDREALRFRYRGADGLPEGAVVTAVRCRVAREDPVRVREIIRGYQAERRRDQPEREPSAGCIFRNPTGRSAGRLIDVSGLKGTEEGGAIVSPVHGNFVINRGGATASDVLRLIERIRERVRTEHGVELELEVRLVGFA